LYVVWRDTDVLEEHIAAIFRDGICFAEKYGTQKCKELQPIDPSPYTHHLKNLNSTKR
jgi:hypothetical protein